MNDIRTSVEREKFKKYDLNVEEEAKSEKCKKTACKLSCWNCREVNKLCPVHHRTNTEHLVLDPHVPLEPWNSVVWNEGLIISEKIVIGQQNVDKAMTPMNALQPPFKDYDILCIQELYNLDGKIVGIPKIVVIYYSKTSCRCRRGEQDPSGKGNSHG